MVTCVWCAPRGLAMKEDFYRRLACCNRHVAEGRDRIADQKARVLEYPECGAGVELLRILDRSLRLLIQRRNLLLEQLNNWPH